MDDTLTLLAKKFNLENFSADEQKKVLKEIGTVVAEGVLRRSLLALSESDTAECDAIIASDADITVLFQFLQKKVPNFQTIVDQEVASLQKTLQA